MCVCESRIAFVCGEIETYNIFALNKSIASVYRFAGFQATLFF